MIQYISEIIEEEANTINSRVTHICTNQQNQLDSIFFNQLGIPGLINVNLEVEDPLVTAFKAR